MYEYLKGKFTRINATQLVVECNGVGYDVNISLNTFSKLKEVENGTVFTHLAVKEDAHILYGFADEEERKMFRLLISVNGVGSNTARVILSSMQPGELQQAIFEGNAPLLQKVKGIGNKTALRIIIDLKDKVGKDAAENLPLIFNAGNTIKNEALTALLVLGFAKPQAEKAIETILRKDAGLKVEDVIRHALAIL